MAFDAITAGNVPPPAPEQAWRPHAKAAQHASNAVLDAAQPATESAVGGEQGALLAGAHRLDVYWSEPARAHQVRHAAGCAMVSTNWGSFNRRRRRGWLLPRRRSLRLERATPSVAATVFNGNRSSAQTRRATSRLKAGQFTLQ